MAFNKISGLQTPVIPALPIALAPAQTFLLPIGQGTVGTFGSIAAPQLASGNPLSGQYVVGLGSYTTLQVYDASMQYWRGLQITPGEQVTVSSDGTNYRVANTSGCVIGATVTNTGTSLTNGLNTVAVTPSAGGSTWNTLVGGAINSTVTITAGGSGYTKPPVLVFTPPANQGSTPYVLPTATCTLSAGAINSVTVTNQGAGLVAAPTITLVNQYGDSGSGGVLTVNATLALSGRLLVMWPSSYGTAAVTAVPTFTFSPASTIAATAIMNFTVTGFTQSTTGAGYVAASGVFQGGVCAASPAASSPGNPFYDAALTAQPIFPPVTVAATTGLPTLTQSAGFTGVNIQAVPTFSAFSTGAAATTAAVTTVTVGGASDVFTLSSL